jgi:hypothetical protein
MVQAYFLMRFTGNSCERMRFARPTNTLPRQGEPVFFTPAMNRALKQRREDALRITELTARAKALLQNLG